MPIGISDEHVELAASLRKWAEGQGSIAAVRAAETEPASLAKWGAHAAEMGLTSIAIPEALGGGGGTMLDQAVALEAAASQLVPGPLLGTAAAGLLIDNDDLRRGIASGEITVGIGLDCAVTLTEGVLAGEVRVVTDALSVSHLLFDVEDEGWFVVPAGRVSLTPGASPDFSHTIGSVALDGVPLSDAQRVEVGDVRAVLLTLAAAEASGVARWCLDTAVEYAGVREQFGQKIGAFQSIKHLCAEMLEHSESVTAAAWDSAAASAEDEDQAQFAALVAGTICFDTAVTVAKTCIQVLGGIGFTFEHDAHLYLRRALVLRALAGGSGVWAELLSGFAAEGIRRQHRIDLDGQDAPFRESANEIAHHIGGLPHEEQRRALVDSGFLAPHWPAPHGLGAGTVQQLVIDEELSAAGVERPDLKIGGWAAPTLLAHGTTEQQQKFVGPTLTGELIWCQLFSEPGAGSDLAALRTKAEKVDGGWRLTGQKVWTSLAHEAHWAICLARTNPEGKPHAGITYFLLDMSAEGIDIRPLREITGEAMFNEVFLDNAFVPDDCVVGEVNGGWKLARTTLANERIAMAGNKLGLSVEEAISLADQARPADRERIGHQVALAATVKLLNLRGTLRSLAGQGPGAESSVAKLVGVRSRQDSAELVLELLGANVFDGSERAREATQQFLISRCLSIAGGTTQILRNVAGERILGLPRG